MCFRPAGVEIDIHCPHCGFKVPIMGTTILKKCPKCKTTFSDEDMETMKKEGGFTDGPAGAGAPAPGAPAAPGAPGAPGAPKAPGM